MRVNGREIASDIYQQIESEIKNTLTKPHLTVLTCAPNFETQKFLSLKRYHAKLLNIGINVVEFPKTVTTNEVIQSLRYQLMQTDAIVIQLPFTSTIDMSSVWRELPVSYDADCINFDGQNTNVMPPAVGAIAEIVKKHDVLLATKHAVVVGNGRLVGQPVSLWLQKQGALVSVVTETTTHKNDLIAAADVLVLGAGKAHMIRKNMIKEGVVVFDAGTSEEAGMLVGDAHEDVSEKASLFTPVPGGIGPITVAVLLRNVVRLAARVAK